MAKYLLGDTDLAARRLKYRTKVYTPSTREFVLDVARYRPHLLVDLGCGPGYTTHFLAELTQCHHTVGLDKSKRFLALARQTETPRVSFCLHNVTTGPFPIDFADLLYCRRLPVDKIGFLSYT